MKKVVNFVVSIEVETESVESPICEESLRENLFSAIENERCEGALTVSDISANWIKVDSVGKEASNGEEVDGENRLSADIRGDTNPAREWLSNKDLVRRVKSMTRVGDVEMPDTVMASKLHTISRERFEEISLESSFEAYILECAIMAHEPATIEQFAEHAKQWV